MSEDIKGDRIRAALRYIMLARQQVDNLERAADMDFNTHPAAPHVRAAFKAMVDEYIAHDPERAERAGLCTSGPFVGGPEDDEEFPTTGPMQ